MFDHGDNYYEQEREQPACWRYRGIFENESEAQGAEEVEVGGPPELLEQVVGHEGEQGVLGRVGPVIWEVRLRLFFVRGKPKNSYALKFSPGEKVLVKQNSIFSSSPESKMQKTCIFSRYLQAVFPQLKTDFQSLKVLVPFQN